MRVRCGGASRRPYGTTSQVGRLSPGCAALHPGLLSFSPYGRMAKLCRFVCRAREGWGVPFSCGSMPQGKVCAFPPFAKCAKDGAPLFVRIDAARKGLCFPTLRKMREGWGTLFRADQCRRDGFVLSHPSQNARRMGHPFSCRLMRWGIDVFSHPKRKGAARMGHPDFRRCVLW